MRTLAAVAAGGICLSLFVACSEDEAPATPSGEEDGGSSSGGPDASADPDASEGGTAAPGTPKRGTRLAPEYRETADGLSLYARMVDTGLGNVPCSPGRAADGQRRCLPDDVAFAFTIFSDATCTTALASRRGTCPKPPFALGPIVGAGCDSTRDVHDVGAVYTGVTYRMEASTCVEVPNEADTTYYVLGPKRAPTDFVKLERRVEPIAGGIGAAMNDGEDGSSAPELNLIDVARGRACAEGTTSDGVTRCVPSGTGTANDGFVDSTCMTRAALVPPPSSYCDALFEPTTATGSDPADEARVRLYELGAKQPGNEFYRLTQSVCDGPWIGSDDIYLLAGEIPSASFPELGTATVGGSRLVATRWTAAGTILPPSAGVRDLALDVRCSFVTSADGKERCQPQGSTIVYADDQCTSRVTLTPAVPTSKYATELAPPGCPRPFHVYERTVEITPKPATVYTAYTGPCTPEPVSELSTVWAVGPELPASSFVEVTRVTK